MKKILFCLVVFLTTFNFCDLNAQEKDSVLTVEQMKAKVQASIDSLNLAIQQANEYAKTVQIKSICGVDFGMSRDTAKPRLINKFGEPEYYPDENFVAFNNKKYAGLNFDSIIFLFQSDGNRTYLNTCIFVIQADDLDSAKDIQISLAEKLEDKYRINWFDEETDEPTFCGGVSPLWNESDGVFSILGEHVGFHSDIIKYKDGISDSPYGVRLIYGGYDYVKEEF